MTAFSHSHAESGRTTRRGLITGGLGVAAAALVPASATADEGHRVLPVPAHDSRYAREWVRAVYDLHVARRRRDARSGRRHPNAARCYAYVVLAMYEAVAAGDRAVAQRRRPAGRAGHGAGAPGTDRLAGGHGGERPCRAHLRRARRGWRRSGSRAITALRDSQVVERRAVGVPRGDDRALPGARPRPWRRVVGSGSPATGSPQTVGLPYTAPVGEGLWVSTPPNFRPAIEPYWARIQPVRHGGCR